MKLKNSILTSLMLLISMGYMSAQSDSSQTKNTVVFGSIYPAFVSTFSANKNPLHAFEMNTALVGFKTDLAKKATAILIYDVARTTSDIVVLDSNKHPLSVNYFKGSEFTAFLKQAEINWKPLSHIEIAIGQLLNEQYLTVQDKFWSYRYVAFTFQERYKFGYPADFGLRVAFNNEHWRISSTISNGEGPFYKQDADGYLMYAINAEYRPNKHYIFKLYSDIYLNNKLNRESISAFVSYKNDNLRLAIEGCIVTNDKWNEQNDYKGYSAFISYNISEKWNLFLRGDYLDKSYIYNNSFISFLGFEYVPLKNFNIAINYRFLQLNATNYNQIALNVGFKF
ncbi:MAG: hypothetical protein HPY79_10595 [Bacteroidales bacterium]|nr:hypothetical protein [Bacteroidales bacterium]